MSELNGPIRQFNRKNAGWVWYLNPTIPDEMRRTIPSAHIRMSVLFTHQTTHTTHQQMELDPTICSLTHAPTMVELGRATRARYESKSEAEWDLRARVKVASFMRYSSPNSTSLSSIYFLSPTSTFDLAMRYLQSHHEAPPISSPTNEKVVGLKCHWNCLESPTLPLVPPCVRVSRWSHHNRA